MVTSQHRDTVVVGCDGSWYSNRAVDAAARIATERGYGLTLLAVPRPHPSGDGSMRGFAEEELSAHERAHAMTRSAEERALAQVPTLRVDRLVGDLDGTAVGALAERAVLLVVGSHGGEGQRAVSLGSLSHDLVRRLGCPVLVPRERALPASNVPHRPRVVVGVDGRGGEEELIGIAAGEAKVRGRSLVIVRAVRSGEVGGGIARPDVWDETWMAVRHAEHTGSVSSRVVVGVGDAVSVLTAECGPEDVLVVGTRGLTRLAGLVAGSVARGVLDAGECDVMVVPPSAQTQAWAVLAAAV